MPVAAPAQLDIATLVAVLKAAAEPTRLRILSLLGAGEHTVKDLTRILGQSQPRLSRHLKLLAEAGLIERAPEGSWVYFRLADTGAGAGLARTLLWSIAEGDGLVTRDRLRAVELKREREGAAQSYFEQHAAEWDKIRALHVAEADVEAAMRRALGAAPVDLLVDIGTGTGRMLELFADRFKRGLGFDLNPAMLAYARAKLERAGLGSAQVRRADIYDLPLAEAAAGAVVMHQVLHFLADPARAIREAARVLAPGGRLLIVDFAPHELEFVRETFAHERLGFAPATIRGWVEDAGLALARNEDLAAAGSGKLTVSLWLAERAIAAPKGSRRAPAQARARKLERTG